MSHTAIASRGENVNLNIFSHPPVMPQPQQPLDHQYTQLFACTKPQTPVSAGFSDEEDFFDLDMVTMDMDFEQAYSMYSKLQQKNALHEVTQLSKAQSMHPQLHAMHRQNRHSLPSELELASFPLAAQGHSLEPELGLNGAVPHELAPLTEHGSTLSSAAGGNPSSMAGAASRSALGSFSGPGTEYSGVPMAKPEPRRLHQSMPDAFQYDFSFSNPSDLDHTLKSEVGAETDLDDSVDDADQFFSTTESDALQRFLDNLAYSSQANPQGSNEQGGGEAQNKKEMDCFTRQQQQQQQQQQHDVAGSLTPPDSAAEEEPRKRRKTSKPLLSLEQKRLNHSHSEQKRRMLCKEAYERCLRLITDVEDYRNDLVSASTMSSSRKKSKRRQLNKEGLPNLSKHTALMKISAEIEKIQSKNDLLRRLAGVST